MGAAALLSQCSTDSVIDMELIYRDVAGLSLSFNKTYFDIMVVLLIFVDCRPSYHQGNHPPQEAACHRIIAQRENNPLQALPRELLPIMISLWPRGNRLPISTEDNDPGIKCHQTKPVWWRIVPGNRYQ
ncbi:hypothetical protein GDO81_012494 [Engystomops pustulosus]|uniref:Uncharacterized protein n=1 Tax=Engystomops pustulosus TaxID=76066 RepID=A0AAV7BMF8_ENGPU|nr:hypothetical protein GDO81_012494 [Engystomops pustulosus]